MLPPSQENGLILHRISPFYSDRPILQPITAENRGISMRIPPKIGCPAGHLLASFASTASAYAGAHRLASTPNRSESQNGRPFGQPDFSRRCGQKLPRTADHHYAQAGPRQCAENRRDRFLQLAKLSVANEARHAVEFVRRESPASAQICRASRCRAHSIVSGRPSAVQFAVGSSEISASSK